MVDFLHYYCRWKLLFAFFFVCIWNFELGWLQKNNNEAEHPYLTWDYLVWHSAFSGLPHTSKVFSETVTWRYIMQTRGKWALCVCAYAPLAQICKTFCKTNNVTPYFVQLVTSYSAQLWLCFTHGHSTYAQLSAQTERQSDHIKICETTGLRCVMLVITALVCLQTLSSQCRPMLNAPPATHTFSRYPARKRKKNFLSPTPEISSKMHSYRGQMVRNSYWR